MISAKLIKSLEQEGFNLEFPSYQSNEERIIEIIKEDNERLLLALPLLLQSDFDYQKIIKKLKKSSIKKFRQILLITDKIFKKEQIENKHLRTTIKRYDIKEKILGKEFDYYYTSFKEFLRTKESSEENILKEQINIRGKLNLNQALGKIYSPGKLRIMEKIFKHEKLTNTELKYYYRSIRPLILAILNENMQKYLRIVDSTKKYY